MIDDTSTRRFLSDLSRALDFSRVGLDTNRRLNEAAAYMQTHKVGIIGGNLWHIILDDAIRMRKEIADLIADTEQQHRLWVEARNALDRIRMERDTLKAQLEARDRV